LNAGL